MLGAKLGVGRAAARAGQPPREGTEQTQVSRLQGGCSAQGSAPLTTLDPGQASCALGFKIEPSRASWERIPVLLGTSAWGLVVKTSSYKDP